MTDSITLRKDIKEKGLKYSFIAQELGITTYSLKKKIDNVTEFKASEIKLLSNVLNYTFEKTNSVFFMDK